MQITGIMAARVNREDMVEVEGEFHIVTDYEWTPNRNLRWTFADGSTYTISPTHTVSALI